MSSAPVSDADILVVGSGMVGAALVCGLAECGFRVAVVERREPQLGWPEDSVDLRVSALSRASRRILENLGAWERMAKLRVSPYTGMEVWDAVGSGRIHFDAGELGEPDLGHIVENRVTQLALWERLGEYSTVQKFCPDHVVRLTIDEGRPSVELASGIRLNADVIVAAEGANSPLREMAGITSHGWSYDQHAITATVWPQLHHGHIARQRFMPTGPLAFLPIDNGSCSIVWSTSPTEANRLMALNEQEFCKELGVASEFVLGRIKRVGPRGEFPLALRYADRYVLPGLALVGDAAHGIHPLAGQGVNMGLLDAADLCDILSRAKNKGRPLGDIATLRQYERARKGENLAVLGLMDLFKRLFSNDNLPLTLVRNGGLNLVNAIGPLKGILARRAMGVTGDLPSLAKYRP